MSPSRQWRDGVLGSAGQFALSLPPISTYTRARKGFLAWGWKEGLGVTHANL